MIKLLVVADAEVLRRTIVSVSEALVGRDRIEVRSTDTRHAVNVLQDWEPTHVLLYGYGEKPACQAGRSCWASLRGYATPDQKMVRVGLEVLQYDDYIDVLELVPGLLTEFLGIATPSNPNQQETEQ